MLSVWRICKRARFSLCPEIYARLCEVTRIGLTRSRWASRTFIVRARGKVLGSPDSKAKKTPADALLWANALRAEVLSDLGIYQSQVSIPSVPWGFAFGGRAHWLMDTGSGLDLIGKRDVLVDCR